VSNKGGPFAAQPIRRLALATSGACRTLEWQRKTDAFAPACMQTGVSVLHEAPSTVNEDCLCLNLWTPAFTNPDGKVLYLGDSITVDGVGEYQ